jgi:hypothetical protein
MDWERMDMDDTRDTKEKFKFKYEYAFDTAARGSVTSPCLLS